MSQLLDSWTGSTAMHDEHSPGRHKTHVRFLPLQLSLGLVLALDASMGCGNTVISRHCLVSRMFSVTMSMRI